MCCDDPAPEAALSFAQLAVILEQPPFEPCVSELEFLTDAEYDEQFTITMRLYFRPVRYLIARITEDYANAADLAQDVFTSIYKARASFEKSYIYRSARNAAYSAIRHTIRHRHAMHLYSRGVKWQPQNRDARPLPDAQLLVREREDAIMLAIERLPEHFRTPLLLFIKGNSYQQIAKVIQTKVGAVKSRICRGKALLRRKLRAYL